MFYIIRIKDNEYSSKAAQRCYDSLKSFYGNNYDFDNYVSFFDAITPKDDPEKILRSKGIKNLNGFIEPYSRWENVLAAFTSHFFCWNNILKSNQPGFIFEHDAVVIDALPIESVQSDLNKLENSPYKIKLRPHHLLGDIVNIGHPSYGKYNTPPNLGINRLTSKKYFPGAHAYFVTPKGAKMLIEKAKENAKPTDIFINIENFPNVQEWNPWPVIVKDNFSTIQNVNGCQAKHGYNPERYKLVQVR